MESLGTKQANSVVQDHNAVDLDGYSEGKSISDDMDKIILF